MPGKRPKQFHRTVSLSQLGDCVGGSRHPAMMQMKAKMAMQIASPASTPESYHRDAGFETMPENMEENCCFGEFEADENPNSVLMEMKMVELTTATATSAPESSHGLLEGIEEKCFGEFEATPLADGNPDYMAMCDSMEQDSLHSLDSMVFKTVELKPPSDLQNHPLPWQNQRSSKVRGTDHGLVLPPPHFLDACHRCSKRLGHGKDVFMYRGDRAFCSVECRHFQIVADERREKCGLASRKEVLEVANNRARGSPSTEGQVGTAAAA